MVKTVNSNMSYACAHVTNSAPSLRSAREPKTSYVRAPMTILGNPKDFKIWSRASSGLGASSDLTLKCSSAPSVAQSEQDERDITNDKQTAALYDHGDFHVVISRRGTKEDALHFDFSDLSDLASSFYPSNDPQLLLQRLHEEQAAERAETASISEIETAAALHLSYQNDLDSSFYSSDDEGTVSDSDIEEEPQLLFLLLQEVEEQAAERVQFASKPAIETAASLHHSDIGSFSYSSNDEETATDAYHGSSSYSSDEEEQEQQQQQVEAPLDVSSLVTNTQSAYQLSSIFTPSVVLTYDLCMGGQMPMYSEEEEQVDEDVHSSQLKWDEWQARVAARTTTVEYEEEPAPLEERIVAASLAPLCTEQEDEDALEWQLEASTEEDQVPEKMQSTGAGNMAQKKRPLLLRFVRTLGRTFTSCLKPSSVRC